MSIMPMKQKCPVCHRYYQWNPDIGQFFCSKCMKAPTGLYVGEIIKAVKRIRGEKN